MLPESLIPYLGLLPLLLGIRAAWRLWRERHDEGADSHDSPVTGKKGAPTALAVAGVTFANGGDDIGVPVFTATNTTDLITYCAVFLVMVGLFLRDPTYSR